MSARASPGAPYDLEALIVTAFQSAERRGKVDWRRMKVAVLKNRLLQLSRGSFTERNHGVSTFRELLATLQHKLRVEGDTVELLGQDGNVEGHAPEVATRDRVRPDLWKAVLDYSSGVSYAWDPETQEARPRKDDDELLLPTVTRDQFQEWKRGFAASRGGDQLLERWHDGGGGTRGLPMSLRGEWNAFVREHVAAHLDEWFKKQGVAPPVVVEKVAIESRSDDPKTEKLRRLVLACVAVMNHSELAAIRLPPEAVLRAHDAGKL